MNPINDRQGGTSSTNHTRVIILSGLQAGAVMGLVAVIASYVVSDRATEAYGVCMACHGRDLLNWIINDLFGTQLPVAPPFLVFPALTTAGVLTGALFAACTNGEFHWHRPENPLLSFLLGILIMNLALLAAGCSTRLLLRTSAGEPLGMAGFTAMVAGVVPATFWIRWRASR